MEYGSIQLWRYGIWGHEDMGNEGMKMLVLGTWE